MDFHSLWQRIKGWFRKEELPTESIVAQALELNYHILGGSNDGNTYTIAMHIPVPDTENEVGVNYRTALVQMRTNPETSEMPKSIVPFIEAAEQAQLDSGELVEHTIAFQTHPGETLVQKRDRIDEKYGTLKVSVREQWIHRLRYWGYDRHVS